jgi:hypothetical protein
LRQLPAAAAAATSSCSQPAAPAAAQQQQQPGIMQQLLLHQPGEHFMHSMHVGSFMRDCACHCQLRSAGAYFSFFDSKMG